jgi:hypothetical protein
LLLGKCEPGILHPLETVLRWKIIRIIGKFTAVAGILSVNLNEPFRLGFLLTVRATLRNSGA